MVRVPVGQPSKTAASVQPTKAERERRSARFAARVSLDPTRRTGRRPINLRRPKGKAGFKLVQTGFRKGRPVFTKIPIRRPVSSLIGKRKPIFRISGKSEKQFTPTKTQPSTQPARAFTRRGGIPVAFVPRRRRTTRFPRRRTPPRRRPRVEDTALGNIFDVKF